MSQNRLADETSPYLLSHKDNPVHWRPWGPEAFEEAEKTGKPVLLSVGYSACHWCHVMNRESFADAETANLMNEMFVNVKVDREERPDLDMLYQTAANVMGHQGGWPLTMFLTAKGEPVSVGGYFPREERLGQRAFKDVLNDVSKRFREQPDAVKDTSGRIAQTLTNIWARDLSGPFDPRAMDLLALHAGQRFDIFYGGLTGAPKFPNTGLTEMLWRAYLRTGMAQFAQLVQVALDNMCMSALFDHVGGGFFRYSTDERWMVPHFEKMLYDNAQLIDLLTLVSQHNRMPLYRARVEETVAWVLREMKVGDAFAASLDAESAGEEGRYYTWSEAEVEAALAGTFAQRFKEVYNIRREGAIGGRNLPHRLGTGLPFPLSEADEAMLARQRDMLLANRLRNRTAPKRDDKVLADWNGLMIAALANAGAVFRNAAWTGAAIRAFDFVAGTMGDGGRLYHSWREGKRGHTGFADDYAHMARAAIALWEATSDKRFLDHAQLWTDILDKYFWDAQNGGYFVTDDSVKVPFRVRSAFDQNATPSANGTMITVLAKLFAVTADPKYRERANAVIAAFSGEAGRSFITISAWLNGIDTLLTGLQIVIVGPGDNPKTQELVSAVMGRSLPARTLMVAAPGETLPEGHPARSKAMENGQPTAYVCQHQTCSAPITNPVVLSQALQLPQAAQRRA